MFFLHLDNFINLLKLPVIIYGDNFVKNTKDVALATLLAVVSFLTHAGIGQMPTLITGIPGIGYYFIIIHTILYSIAALLFQGRRWRLLFMTGLIVVLTLPLFLGGPPFDIISRLPIITSAFFFDLFFNSLYELFNRKNLLALWAISGVTFQFMCGTLLTVPINLLFYTPEVVQSLFNIISAFLPVILVESIIGGYLGYQVYKRIKSVG